MDALNLPRPAWMSEDLVLLEEQARRFMQAEFVPHLEQWHEQPEVALAHYEAARRERTTRVVNGSAEMTGKFHNDALADAAGAEAYVNAEWHPAKIAERYDWIYQYEAATVAL